MAERMFALLSKRVVSPESCITRAEVMAGKIRHLGGEYRLVPSGETVDVEKILRRSLLGLGENIDIVSLNPQERYLYQRYQDERIMPRILLVTDFDGVWVSPAHNWKESGNLDEKVLTNFAHLCQNAERVVLRTSRFLLSGKIVEPLNNGNVGRFPVFKSEAEALLQEKVSTKIKVICGKNLIDPALDLYELIRGGWPREDWPDFTYIVISSERDEHEMRDLFKNYPRMSGNVIAFHTCHKYL